MTAELIPLAPGLSVAGQLDRADIDALARNGVRTIINNRPDDEDAGQLPASEAQKPRRSSGYRLSPHSDYGREPVAC